MNSAPIAQGDPLLLRVTKYNGEAHWIQHLRVVSYDGLLLQAHSPAGSPIFTSRGEFRSRYDSYAHFWQDRWYNVFRLAEPGAETALWYCNVTTPPEFGDGEIRYIDLDLDVTVRAGGTIELLDVDEFEEHRLEYGYPPDVRGAGAGGGGRALDAGPAPPVPVRPVGRNSPGCARGDTLGL